MLLPVNADVTEWTILPPHTEVESRFAGKLRTSGSEDGGWKHRSGYAPAAYPTFMIGGTVSFFVRFLRRYEAAKADGPSRYGGWPTRG